MALRFTRLDRPSIRRLEPGEKITEHGITAERLANGDVRYSVNIMVDGARIHRVIGRESEGVTRTQAEEFIARARSDAKEGRLSLPRGRKLHLTFAAAAELYLDRQREIGGRNLVSKEQHLRLHLVPYFGSMRLDRITPFTLEKFRKHCRGKGLSPATTNRVLATYRHLARRLLEWGAVKAPMPAPKLEAEDNRRTYVLTEDEEDRLLGAALRDSNPYVWLFIKVGIGTGMRHREILSARFNHFNPVRRRLRVWVKGGKWREQPLTRTMTELLFREREMAQDPEGWVFPSNRTASGHTESMNKPFARCVIAAGLDPGKVTPHILRHTAITRLAATGADVATVKAFSGHKTLQMVMHYTHAQDRHVDKALDLMERAETKVEHTGAPKARNS